jgi:hypothetical protein
MGLTNYVYPGAMHTRYSHSLGVYWIIKKMITARNDILKDSQIRRLELAALLHDIGHVPLSHTIEKALSKFEELERPNKEAQSEDLLGKIELVHMEKNIKPIQTNPKPDKLHEKLGAEVIRYSGISEALKRIDIRPEEIGLIIRGTTTVGEVDIKEISNINDISKSLVVYRNFMHSQLDADRIDYLMRDATFTGVKAGIVDIDKLLNEIYYDQDGNYGVKVGALRALEQFFSARLSAYSQIPFNKHVHGFELMASKLYYNLLCNEDKRAFDYNTIVSWMKEGEWDKWQRFTDYYFYWLIEQIKDDSKYNGQQTSKLALNLFRGCKLEVIHFEQQFCTPSEWDAYTQRIESKIKLLEENKQQISKKVGISEEDIIIDTTSTDMINAVEDPLFIYFDGYKLNVANSHETFLSSMAGKRLYIRRAFTFEARAKEKIRHILGLDK